MKNEKRPAGRRANLFLIAGLSAVLLSAVPLRTVSAAQGEEIIHLDFDDGTLDGFETYMEGGECELRNEDGRLAVSITGCGSLDYANQAYRDGFSLDQNCTYNYSFDISCSIERQVEYRLQLNGGDYHAYLGEKIRIGQEPVHVSVDWTMTEETDPAPRLCFNMGYEDDMAQDPGAHTVWIDNISLTVLDDSGMAGTDGEGTAGEKDNGVRIFVNQTGYRPSDAKTVWIRYESAGAGEEASVPEDAMVVTDLSVVDESGARVLSLSAGEPFYDTASGSWMQRADFSALTGPGSYQIRAGRKGQEVSCEPFEIDEDPYDDLLKDAVRMLYLQRCGTQVSLPDDPEAEPFAHGVCHSGPALIYGTDRKMDVSGGWHDAGDYGRYVVPGAKAVADLFLAYDLYGCTSDDLGIPESGNGVPDVLDEARWELDWMRKMQDQESGGVYHKVTCRSFPGEVRPEEETDELVICPVSVTATLDFAAVMAKASRLYASFDPDFARTALEAAEKAWEYGAAHEIGGGFHNPPEISTGEYPDTDASDELLWAACELQLAGALDGEEVSRRLDSFSEHGLGWQCVSDYALMDLAFAGDSGTKHTEPAKETALSKEDGAAFARKAQEYLVQYREQLMRQAENDGYFLTLGGDYPWGSNMTVANHGILLDAAGRLTGDESCIRCAKQNLDYLLGANPTGYCYVTGHGTLSPEHPHHRPSQAAGTAMKGMLVGGPDNHLEDPYAQNVLAGKAPALCYADNSQSYSTNEVAIYWNSPLIVLLAALS